MADWSGLYQSGGYKGLDPKLARYVNDLGLSVIVMIEKNADATKTGQVVSSVGKGYAARSDGITCGGRLETESGSFTSPNYPEPYPNNAKCIWYIQVAKRHRITLKLDGFQLEASLWCSNDYVAIYDGASTNSPLIATICTGSNHTFTSSSNTMTIYFKSDHLKTSAGFTARYYSQPLFQIATVGPVTTVGLVFARPDEVTCGGRLETESGSFTSPNYPEQYPNNAQCIWYIQVAKRHRISLKLDGFQLEVSLSCSNDYVAIYDGASTNSPLIATICTGTNHAFTSSSNTMTIYFKSDHLKTGAGFTAHYYSQPLFQITTVGPDGLPCGGMLETESGSFTSPNYPEPYPNNAKCIWYIQVAKRHRITLKLDGFQLEASLWCTKDYVEIYDGASIYSPLIETVCTGSNHTFTSSSNSMTICFRSDHLKTSAGFTARYYSQQLFKRELPQGLRFRPG
ncbi:scavenger receptor cysteine-rich domain-containing protein DMBT1-like [Scyliorhinus torazame]|uniref:scavenger receptor cysteine-rich domain-containing protein DMBT1-like n=1 Tax=Scyliorhinus torazame TaxID=75743 RepID=UPI003B5AE208